MYYSQTWEPEFFHSISNEKNFFFFFQDIVCIVETLIYLCQNFVITNQLFQLSGSFLQWSLVTCKLFLVFTIKLNSLV